MQNENYPIVIINTWIYTMGHAAGRTGAARSAVVVLQNMYFTLSIVLLYSIYYDFETKLFLDYCLQTGTWLCRYLTNDSPILSFNHYVPQSTCTPNGASGIQYFCQKSLKLIIPGLHNISWSPNSLFSIFAIVIFIQYCKLLTHTRSWIVMETVSSETLQRTEFTVPRPES